MMDIDKLKDLMGRVTPDLRPTQYDGYYVDAEGGVWSAHNWRGYGLRQLAPKPNSHGYLAVKVKIEGGMKKMLVHKEVCVAFHGPKPSETHQVRHLNGVRHVNVASNLAWGTASENAIDRQRHGTCRAASNSRASAAIRAAIKRQTDGGHHANG